jgi:hypothetical protein
MINYGNSRALVIVNEKNTIKEENEWREGNVLEGEPLKIEFNENVFGEMPSTKQHFEEEEEVKIEQMLQ